MSIFRFFPHTYHGEVMHPSACNEDKALTLALHLLRHENTALTSVPRKKECLDADVALAIGDIILQKQVLIRA